MSKEKKLLLFSALFMILYTVFQMFYVYYFSKQYILLNTIGFILGILGSIVFIYYSVSKVDLSKRRLSIFLISILFIVLNVISGIISLFAYKNIEKKDLRELPKLDIMKNYKWYIYILVLIVYFVIAFTDIINNLISNKYQYYLLNIFVIVFLVFVFRKDLKRDFKLFIKYFKEYNLVLLKMYGLSLITLVALSLLIRFITGIDNATNQVVLNSLFKQNPLLLSFLAIIYAPITEEIIFRGVFRKLINNKWIFIFVSGFLFGLAHVIDDFQSVKELLYIFVYGSLGCYLAATYYKTNNMFTNICFHFLQNTFAITVMYLLSIFNI